MKFLFFVLTILGLFFMTSFDCNTRLTKSELLAHQGVYAVMPPDFDFDFKFKVLSYDWIFRTKNDTYFGSAKGSPYPDQLIKHIKASNPNDLLIIENVRVLGDDNSNRKIPGLTIVVK